MNLSSGLCGKVGFSGRRACRDSHSSSAIPDEDAFLGYCPNLRSVTFLNPTSRLYQLGAILYAALKNVSSERVERIAVELHLGSRDELRITASDLVTLHYPHLQEVIAG
jgi:hypothetical protein